MVNGRDGPVVVEQVALRDAFVRPERLVEVPQLDPARRGLGRLLPSHLPRGLVVAQALEGRRPQMVVVRPLRELDLAHEARLDPGHVALAHLRHLRHHRQGRRLAPQRLELREQLVDVPLAEAGAAVADPVQLAAAIGAEHQRAEAPGAAALALRPAADHELLTAVRLDLQPVPRPLPLAVRRRRNLRHHAFEALLRRHLAQRLAVGERARDLD
jgi:hypothetical protein